MAGSALLGTVRVGVLADVAKATQGFRGFANTVSKTSKEVVKSLRPAAEFVADFAQTIAEDFLETMKDIEAAGDAAANIGIDVSEYSRIKFAAESAGVGMGALNSALEQMQKTITAGDEDGPLAKLGINIEHLQQLDTIKRVSEIAKQLERVGDVRIGKEIFGTNFVEFFKMLEDGTQQFEEMTEKADDYQRVIDTDMVKAARRVNKQIERIKQSWIDVGTQIQAAVAPWVADTLEGVVAIIEGLNRIIADMAPRVGPETFEGMGDRLRAGRMSASELAARTAAGQALRGGFLAPGMAMTGLLGGVGRAAGAGAANYGRANAGAITAEERAAFKNNEETAQNTQATVDALRELAREMRPQPAVQIP